jgi:hypothetical protein
MALRSRVLAEVPLTGLGRAAYELQDELSLRRQSRWADTGALAVTASFD